ncbi:Uncharacterised protein [Achromobacter xylosoxidans]|nr:Uncharacterised protein [Achromobacter xylosoxidans]CUJ18008.1 Uncharacterised protein [Achromobacter xylosoxidans]CUJ92635.1 Uncharacterised protein [Achromobacter xylosoxidans]
MTDTRLSPLVNRFHTVHIRNRLCIQALQPESLRAFKGNVRDACRDNAVQRQTAHAHWSQHAVHQQNVIAVLRQPQWPHLVRQRGRAVLAVAQFQPAPGTKGIADRMQHVFSARACRRVRQWRRRLAVRLHGIRISGSAAISKRLVSIVPFDIEMHAQHFQLPLNRAQITNMARGQQLPMQLDRGNFSVMGDALNQIQGHAQRGQIFGARGHRTEYGGAASPTEQGSCATKPICNSGIAFSGSN